MTAFPLALLALALAAPAPSTLDVRPAAIALDGPFAYAQLVVTATQPDGSRVDVTRESQIVPPGKLLALTPQGLARPAAEGAGSLSVSYRGKTVEVPVTVAALTANKPVSFVQDVQPVLSKLGCNQGTCHGSAQGKSGFKLSLRGYDPIFDHRALTDDLEGRRFNRAAPERSLMLLKPSGGVPHVGGVVMQPGDTNYEILRRWIAGGIALDLDAPRVTSIELFPANLTIPRPGMKQQYAVVATYADGRKRDVSAEAFLESSNTETLTVDKAGLLSTLRRGEATILARYEGAYAASTAIVLGDRAGFAWKPLPVYSPIDSLVDAKLQKVKIPLGELCDDPTFLRRVHIDLTGLPPTADEVRAFLADSRESRVKRDAVIDRLVGSEAFVDHWTNRWADLLQVNRKFLGEPGAAALKAWIKKAVADNLPYDQFAYQVLTASGSNVDNPPAAYFKTLRTPDALMENTTQLFMAVRFNCNKCHDHPFEKWTQDQYFELAAYFAQVARGEDQKFKGQRIGGNDVEMATPLVEMISDAGKGEFKHDRTGLDAKPKFPFTHPGTQAAPSAARREQLAKWLTAPENPYFARSYANRVWSYLTGVGVIEPVDDIRAGNPATNPELLAWLTDDLVQSNFDTRKLIKDICKSRTYQLAITTTPFNRDDEMNYSHALPRRLPAEVLFDGIHRATGSPSRLPGLPAGARAAQLLDSNVDLPGGFLELFGKPVRESACECERSNTMMLGPVLAMVNGPIVAQAVADPAGRLAQFTAATPDDARVVEEIYLSVLNRKPTAAEVKAGVEAIRGAGADFARLSAEAKARADALAAYERGVPAKQAAWEADLRGQRATAWTTLAPENLKAKSGSTLTLGADGAVLASGPNAGNESYTFTAPAGLKTVTAIRLEVLTDPSLPRGGPGRAPNANFVLNEFQVEARPANGSAAKPVKLKLAGAAATFAQDGFPVANAADGNLATGWAIDPKGGTAQAALFTLKTPLASADGAATLAFTLEQRYGSQHSVGKFRVSVTGDPKPALASPVTPDLLAMLDTPAEKRSPEVKAKLGAQYAATDKELQRLRGEAGRPGPGDARVLGAQDLTWALINSPAFLFNH